MPDDFGLEWIGHPPPERVKCAVGPPQHAVSKRDSAQGVDGGDGKCVGASGRHYCKPTVNERSGEGLIEMEVLADAAVAAQEARAARDKAHGLGHNGGKAGGAEGAGRGAGGGRDTRDDFMCSQLVDETETLDWLSQTQAASQQRASSQQGSQDSQPSGAAWQSQTVDDCAYLLTDIAETSEDDGASTQVRRKRSCVLIGSSSTVSLSLSLSLSRLLITARECLPA